MRARATSHAAAAARGWRRVDDCAHGKCGARWLHRDGWTLEHCGHPTALWPWLLKTPGNQWILAGVLNEENPDPTHGYAWRSLDQAMEWVASPAADRLRLGTSADKVA